MDINAPVQDIILTKQETSCFLENMRSPNKEALAKRDAFLSEMNAAKKTVNADGSQTVDLPSLDLSFLRE